MQSLEHGVWAIQGGFPLQNIQTHQRANRLEAFTGSDGVAVIPLVGVLDKGGFYGTSTVATKTAVEAAANSPAVKGIFLLVESPGGAVAGTAALADAVYAARQRKPVYAFIEDVGASGAYWVASQATKVFTNQTGIVGSIGTYSVVYDYSQAAERAGVKVHVIKAGAHKGAGVGGAPVTPEQLAEWQRVINAMNAHFIEGVARGRGMKIDAVKALADGRVHIGQDAAKLKLVDGVATRGEVAAALSGSPAGVQMKGPTMSQYSSGDAVAEFNEAVAAKMQTGMDRRRATIAVCKENPDLHAAFVRATNEQQGRSNFGRFKE